MWLVREPVGMVAQEALLTFRERPLIDALGRSGGLHLGRRGPVGAPVRRLTRPTRLGAGIGGGIKVVGAPVGRYGAREG